MSILKQNGVNGKVIRAQGSGKVLKQNYNFGRNFKMSGVGVDFKIRDLFNSMEACSILLIFKRPSLDFKKLFVLQQTDQSVIFSIKTQARGAYIDYPISLGYAAITSVEPGTPLFQLFYFTRNTYGFRTNYATKDPVQGTDFEPFFENDLDTLSLNPDKNVFDQIHRLVFFNRILSDVEFNYIYSNGIGSDIINNEGIVVDFNFNSASIVNIEGVDYVGIINRANSNYNASITGLPSGTLQEQLDYANANLFEIW